MRLSRGQYRVFRNMTAIGSRAPVDVHSTNWLWINKTALDAVGGKPPTNWDQLIAVLDKMKAKGIIAARPGRPALAGGDDVRRHRAPGSAPISTRKPSSTLDPAALRRDKWPRRSRGIVKLRVLCRRELFRPRLESRLRHGHPGQGRDADDGRLGQGRIPAAGKKPGEDFVCIRFPGTQGAVTFNSDQFVMFKAARTSRRRSSRWPRPSKTPKFHRLSTSSKARSRPAPTCPTPDFDACGKKGMADLKEANQNGTLFGSMAHGYAVPAAIKNAIYDVVTGIFNGDIDRQRRSSTVRPPVTSVGPAGGAPSSPAGISESAIVAIRRSCATRIVPSRLRDPCRPAR